MHHAQLLAYGLEGRLADVLQELAQGRALWLREVRHVKTCLNLLRRGGAGVLVLRLGKNLDQELSLVEQVTRQFPTTRTIVVGNADNPPLAALAWDLGAAYVLFPPQPVEWIRELVQGFLPGGPEAQGA
jgi:DNA-binding NarL/FixJ family response regulator